MNDLSLMHGNVKWFNEKKGYGFIDSDGISYFVHYKSIIAEGFKKLDGDQRVSFVPKNSDKGWLATDVRVVSSVFKGDY